MPIYQKLFATCRYLNWRATWLWAMTSLAWLFSSNCLPLVPNNLMGHHWWLISPKKTEALFSPPSRLDLPSALPQLQSPVKIVKLTKSIDREKITLALASLAASASAAMALWSWIGSLTSFLHTFWLGKWQFWVWTMIQFFCECNIILWEKQSKIFHHISFAHVLFRQFWEFAILCLFINAILCLFIHFMKSKVSHFVKFSD